MELPYRQAKQSYDIVFKVYKILDCLKGIPTSSTFIIHLLEVLDQNMGSCQLPDEEKMPDIFRQFYMNGFSSYTNEEIDRYISVPNIRTTAGVMLFSRPRKILSEDLNLVDSPVYGNPSDSSYPSGVCFAVTYGKDVNWSDGRDSDIFHLGLRGN